MSILRNVDKPLTGILVAIVFGILCVLGAVWKFKGSAFRPSTEKQMTKNSTKPAVPVSKVIAETGKALDRINDQDFPKTPKDLRTTSKYLNAVTSQIALSTHLYVKSHTSQFSASAPHTLCIWRDSIFRCGQT